MAVPEQVKKQTEAVQALYEDLNKQETPPDTGEAVPANDEAPGIQAQETPANSVPEPAPQPEPVEPGNGDQDETFEQKYRTLQGMYNADVPRLNAQNQELAYRVQQMEQLIATMQAAPAPEPEPAPKPILTEEELEEYGESIDIMRKVSQEVAASYEKRIAELTNTVQQLQGSVVPRVEQIAMQHAQTVEQTFWSDLQNAVPNWRDINGEQGFQSWLLEIDPLSGLSRQTYLDDAQRNMDAARVAGFFTSWQQVNGAPQAQPDRPARTSELEKQVAPGRSRSSGTPQSDELPTYTSEDITKFFRDVREGKFKGKEDERDKLERDIFAAQREGRIVNA